MGNQGSVTKNEQDSEGTGELVENPMATFPLNLIIKTYTWKKDSHGLYDYQGLNVVKRNLKLSGPGKLYRIFDDIRFSDQIENMNLREDEKQNLSQLLVFYQKQNSCWLDSGFIIKEQQPTEDNMEGLSENSVWLVIKSLQAITDNKGYCLKTGDYLQMGRLRFRVKEMSAKPAFSQPVEQGEIKEIAGKICRICLSEGTSHKNPLISPCNCSGSVQYVHLQCLRYWFMNKIVCQKHDLYLSFNWKPMQCELCKKPISPNLVLSGKSLESSGIVQKSGPYILLQVLGKDQNIAQGLFMIFFYEGQQVIQIGRGNESVVRLPDISVSRFHATIKLEKGQFYLDDNCSQFGTLVLVRKPIELLFDISKVSIQIGRTLCFLTIQESWSSFPACCSTQRKRKLEDQLTTFTSVARTTMIQDLYQQVGQDDQDQANVNLIGALQRNNHQRSAIAGNEEEDEEEEKRVQDVEFDEEEAQHNIFEEQSFTMQPTRSSINIQQTGLDQNYTYQMKPPNLENLVRLITPEKKPKQSHLQIQDEQIIKSEQRFNQDDKISFDSPHKNPSQQKFD